MPRVRFTPPRHWEDWISWVLGFWLCISPWALLYSLDAHATENAVIVGALLILTEVITLSVFESWEEWINVAIGAWLIASAWVLPLTSTAARVNFVSVGVLVVLLAVYELWGTKFERS